MDHSSTEEFDSCGTNVQAPVYFNNKYSQLVQK